MTKRNAVALLRRKRKPGRPTKAMSKKLAQARKLVGIRRRNPKRRTSVSTAKPLWTWNWVGGGFNQTFAKTKAEALKYARKLGRGSKGRKGLVVDEASLKCRKTPAEQDAWWRSSSSWD